MFFLIARKYRIDLHLKRFTSALNHISKCVPEYVEECLDLVKNQRLYLEAISIFQNSKNKDMAKNPVNPRVAGAGEPALASSLIKA